MPEVKKELNWRNKNNPESRKNETLKMIESGVPDFSVTREGLKWGYPFLMIITSLFMFGWSLINYATVLGYPGGEDFKIFTTDLHIIGADINKFHTSFGWQCFCPQTCLCRKKFYPWLFTINGQK